MPQMVGMLNGFGGGASILVALSEYFKKNPNYPIDTGLTFNLPIDQGIAIILSILIGGVTFTGSMIAFGKLQGIVTGKVVKYPMQHPMNALLFLGVMAASNDKHCIINYCSFFNTRNFISAANWRCRYAGCNFLT